MIPAFPVLRGHRVLVVEDEALLAMEFAEILRQQGCTVVGPARSVQRALALLDEQIDAALLDLNLDGESGVPVAAALDERDVPFVVVSGYGKACSTAPALRRAMRLSKPVQHDALVWVLVQLLGPSAD